MRLAVTGGGTGGHVYPALEVAQVARSAGCEVSYVGSLRGIEASECDQRGFQFHGVASVPLAALWTPKGLRSMLVTVRAISAATAILSKNKSDLVFSTGGYSAGPVLSAARAHGIPCVIHEQNTVPGRTHKYAARFAKRACVVFDESSRWLRCPTVRTGMPLRHELVEIAAEQRAKPDLLTLVIGGSQGAAAINEAVLTLVTQHGSRGEWLHIAGPKLYENAVKASERLGSARSYRVRPFLNGSEMAAAISEASIAISRAGAGTLCELALFGVPAVLIPYPFAQADHQYHNAKAIEKIGGALVMRQSEMTPQSLASSWLHWADDAAAREEASRRLKTWAISDAAVRVWEVLKEVAAETQI